MAAGAPHAAPFMADECLLAMPEIDSLDYTMKEYMRYVDYVKVCVDRLNSQGNFFLISGFFFYFWLFFSTQTTRGKSLAVLFSLTQLCRNSWFLY